MSRLPDALMKFEQRLKSDDADAIPAFGEEGKRRQVAILKLKSEVELERAITFWRKLEAQGSDAADLYLAFAEVYERALKEKREP